MTKELINDFSSDVNIKHDERICGISSSFWKIGKVYLVLTRSYGKVEVFVMWNFIDGR